MKATRRRLEALITAIQNEFLDTPGLALTLSDTGKRFDADRVTCQALLDVLVETCVLTRRPTGTYVRYFPRLASSRTADMLQHQGRRSGRRNLTPQAA